MQHTRLLWMFTALGALAASASCGAKSGLDAPVLAQDGGGGQAPVTCRPGTISLTRAQPTIMFVIDRSGSMGRHLGENNGEQSRWEILGDALAATLPQVDQAMAIGALVYPASGSSGKGASCEVPAAPDLAPVTGHVGQLLTLMFTTSPGGATPTAAAIDTAAGLLLGVRAASTARALVLATDGGPDCNPSLDPSTCRCVSGDQKCKDSKRCLDDVRTVAEIAKVQAQQLPTYVIGIQDDGDDSLTDVLDAMADAGGRPKLDGGQHYYAARSKDELSTALSVIRDQVGACVFLAGSVPDPGGSITVSAGDVPIHYDPAGKEGWSWGDRENGEMVFAGSACAAVTAAGDAALVARVTCEGP